MKLEVKDNCPLNGFEPCKTVRLCVVHENPRQQPQHRRTHRRVGLLDGVAADLLIENAQQSRVDRSGGREFQKRDGVGQSGEPAPTKTSQNRGPPA